MMDGNLTVLALIAYRPGESDARIVGTAVHPAGPPARYNANNYMRYLNDVTITWKASDALTLVTEANWIRDDFDGIFSGKPSPANAFGVAQYCSYMLSDTVTFNARGEIYRDDNGVFVTAFTGNNDFVRGELGFPALSPVLGTAPRGTTYGEITIGLTFKPTLPAPISGLLIRPELRVDDALSGGHPFGNGNSSSAVTIASDFVLTF